MAIVALRNQTLITAGLGYFMVSKHLVVLMSSRTIGLVAGLAIALPLLGAALGIPSSIAAAAMVSITCIPLTPRIFARLRDKPFLSISLVLGFLFAICVLAVSHDLQWSFLASPWLWSRNAEMYFEAKLFMFSLTFGTAFLSGLLLLAADDKEKMLLGLCLGVCLVSTAASARILVLHGGQLWATSYDDAAAFFYAKHGFSLVSYGILMILGAICAMKFRGGWWLAALYLITAVLLARRVDAVLILLSFATIQGWLILWRREFFRLGDVAAFAALSAVLISLGSNGVTTSYFSGTVVSAETRMEILAEATVAQKQTPEIPDGEFENGEQTTGGLGFFATGVISPHNYPHNLPIEVYYEIGFLGAAAFAAIVLWPIFRGFRRLGLLDRDALIPLLLLGTMFGFSLKGGDITNFGMILFFAVLCEVYLNQIDGGCTRRQNHPRGLGVAVGS